MAKANWIKNFVILICLISGNAFAGFTGWGVNTNFFKVGSQGLVVYLTPSISDEFGCSGNTTINNVIIELSHPEYSELYAAVMLAHANNKEIGFYVVGCSSSSLPIVDVVYVK